MKKLCALLVLIVAVSIAGCGGTSGSGDLADIVDDPIDNPSGDTTDDPTGDSSADSTSDDGAGGDELPSYTIGLTVAGLMGGGLTLQNNGGDDLSVPSNGSYVFNTGIADNEKYDVTISNSPADPQQKCTVKNGSGTVSGGDVTDVEIACDLNWVQDAYLKASNASNVDYFGSSVAINENYMVVGVPDEDGDGIGVVNTDNDHGVDNNSFSLSGAAYVFKRDGSGNWIQDAYLKASNPSEQDRFGTSVAIDGNIIIVGAPYEDGNGIGVVDPDGTHGADDAVVEDSGAAYIFKQVGSGDWVQDAYLKASNAEAGDHFGAGVAVSNYVIAVGAIYEDGNGTTVINNDGEHGADDAIVNGSGAVYVFKKDFATGNWIQDAYLKASNAAISDNFGDQAIAMYEDTIVVGVQYEDGNGTSVVNTDGEHGADDSYVGSSGAAYVFKRDESDNWYQDAYLKSSNSEANDYFGYSVDVSGDTIVVGAKSEDGNGTTVVNGDGEHGADDGIIEESGAAYVFRADDAGNWYQDAYFKASNAESNDFFGGAVAISGDIIIVGAIGEDGNDMLVDNNDVETGIDNSIVSSSGAAYVFKRDDQGNWIQDAYLKASNSGAEDEFGKKIALDGDFAIIIAEGEDSADTAIDNDDGGYGLDDAVVDGTGAGYVFKLTQE